MCVMQCRCGMVVSTRQTRSRCIRCGAILGPRDELQLRPEQSRAECEARNNGEANEEAHDADPRGDGGHAALAAYVSLVMRTAAKAVWERRQPS